MVNACPSPADPTSSSSIGLMPMVNCGPQPYWSEAWEIPKLCWKWGEPQFSLFDKANHPLPQVTFYALGLECLEPGKIESFGLEFQFHPLELWETCIQIQMSWLVHPPSTDSNHLIIADSVCFGYSCREAHILDYSQLVWTGFFQAGTFSSL